MTWFLETPERRLEFPGLGYIIVLNGPQLLGWAYGYHLSCSHDKVHV